MLAADGIVINKKKEILLVRRNHAPYKNRWALPGGFVEKGETVGKTAMRECLEESGIRTKIIKLVDVYSGPRRDPRGHVVSVAFLMRPVTKTTKTSNETSDVRFFPIEKIPKKLAADHDKIIKDALRVYLRKH
ncbi:MAG: NUDIX hydrolase [Candidatus Aenigmarchaeota archaeon]|nr:NUDIX hydrolase [Candidatus Aenigmarchaeota archaeon]